MTAANSWKEVSVGQHANLLNGFAFPSEGFTDNGGISLIRIRDLRKQSTDVNYRGKFDTKYLVRRGDLLIGMDGDFDTVRWKGNDALLNQRVCKLETKDPKEVVQDFLFYRIIDEVIRINRITAATTVKHLSSGDVLGIRFKLPLEPEQSKIAEILSTVDRAIEQTEALIAKRQRIKTGLMQDLLTRGIDEQGNLRSEETHQFKDSPLGRIPVEWDCPALSKITCKLITYGIVQPGPHIADGIPFVQTKDLTSTHLDVRKMDRTSREIHSSYERSSIRAGDVLIGIRASVGSVVFVPPALDRTNISRGIARLSPAADVDARYLFWVLQAKNVQNGIRLEIKGSTYPEITLPALRSIEVPLPKPDEQAKSSAILDSVDSELERVRQMLNKLSSLKTALMRDLLTGEKRVTPLLEHVESL